VKNWLGLGSQAEYGPQSRPIDESAPTRPTTLYGAAKLSVCVTAERLCDGLGVRFAWLRLFSSYGPGDHPNWMIPYLIEKLLNGERPSLTAGEQLWDYIYAADAAAAIAAVARQTAATGVFNLGSGRAEPLRRIVERIRDGIDPRLPLGFGEIPYRPDQVMRLEADISRLRAATGWAPRTPLETGLAKTIEWHRERRRG
jgi:nucleoside-diphosphate-sugar epimerase